MTLIEWPQTRTQILIAYNFFGASLTTVPAFLWLKPLGVSIAALWSLFWLYDLVIRPNLFPESEMDQEERAMRKFEQQMASGAQQNHQQMRRIGQRLSDIESDHENLKQEYDELQEEKQELQEQREELARMNRELKQELAQARRRQDDS